MIIAILIAVLAYRKANENGRNGILWAIVGLAVFIGTQLLVGAAIGVFFLVGMAMWDWPESMFESYTWPINIVAIVAAGLASWGLLAFLGRQPRSEPGVNQPPPPPSFGG